MKAATTRGSEGGPFLSEARRILSAPEDLALNISRFKHQDIVAGLHHLVYDPAEPTYQRQRLRVSHNDGSESAPFPVTPLGPAVPSPDEKVVPLRLGFVSGRHLDLDAAIDLYLVRNHEVELFDCSADGEQDVYERTVALLMDGAFLATGGVIQAYHTGLEFLTVAFYRAIVETALMRRKQQLPLITVLPLIWRRAAIDLTQLLGQAGDALREDRLLACLLAQVAALPEFLRLDQRDDGPGGHPELSLVWLKQRPMWVSERDLLCRRAPYARTVIDNLYRRTKYQQEQPWGVG
jgi:hypothetical protein